VSDSQRPPAETDRAVLIVDPSKRDREALALSFPAGWRVAQCANLVTAKNLLALEKPQLLIVELNIEGGTGFDVVEALAATHRPCHLVLLSEQLSVAAAVRAFALRFDAVVSKPTTADQLLLHVQADEVHAEAAERMSLERAAWEYIWRQALTTSSRKEAARRLGLQARSLRRMLQRIAPR
jgi:two-component system response regulator RegA